MRAVERRDSPDLLLLQTSDGVLQVGAEAWDMVSGSVPDDPQVHRQVTVNQALRMPMTLDHGISGNERRESAFTRLAASPRISS